MKKSMIDAAQTAADEAAGTYSAVPDEYGETYRAALAAAADPAPFTYDVAADPAYQAYRKAYTREGRRAAEDTLGAYAAMTGGVPSTAAVTASQQAGDYYAAQLADKVPELYKLAYDMYDAAEGRRIKALAALAQARGDELARWDAQQSRLADERDYEYRRERDAYADSVALAKLASANGDDSGLAALGIDLTDKPGKYYAYDVGTGGAAYEIGSAKGKAFVEGAAPGQTMTGGDGSTWTKTDTGVTITKDGRTWTLTDAVGRGLAPGNSGSSGSRAASAKPDLTAAQVNSAIANGIRTDKVLEAYEYYYGEPYAEPADVGRGLAPGSMPIDWGSVEALGYGPISEARLAELVASGAVEEYVEGGRRHYRRKAAAKANAPSFADRVGASLGA